MKFKYTVKGLDCPNCAAKLAANISKAEGVCSAKINFLTEKLTIESELPEQELFKLAADLAKNFSKNVKIEK